ncbi:uncharacterized protein EDB91DRAFT_1088334 [Suillus paluster]|uniref:uncharacterized protein n=1 Tax=Suillus paluster TaxID=48578 RepID=UPI001B87708D|nr:uncharacterized protein EDB91DRAFT_1088334 [Suillus paluster]KAG1721818.1 hypothetical protein EDB91DRAFT_1088334 [Suillus paluster]
MHAYCHEWACQLEYNPQMSTGLGLSDSEGTERLWSRFVKLIGIQCSSSRQRHLWLIDRKACAIGLEMQVDLSDWIKWRLKRGVNAQGTAAKEVLTQCSIKADDLQTQYASDKALQATRTVIEKGSVTEETLDALESLEHSHDKLMNKVKVLYSSLNVHDRFPELQGVNLDFV